MFGNLFEDEKIEYFDPTYEAWKLSGAIAINSSYFASFRSYLRGMETLFLCPLPIQKLLFRSYLRGMETGDERRIPILP